MKNDSLLFPEDLPFDNLFDPDGDKELTGTESIARSRYWLEQMDSGLSFDYPDHLSLLTTGKTRPDSKSKSFPKTTVPSAKYRWRDTCEDGWVYGVRPSDYETEQDCYRALNRAKVEERQRIEEESHRWHDFVDPADAASPEPLQVSYGSGVQIYVE